MSIAAPALPPTLSNSSPLANGFALRRDPFGFFQRLVAEAGDFAHYELNDGIFFLVNEPALVRQVLVTQGANFRKWAFNDSFRAIFRTGLIGSDGEMHRRMQRIARPALHKPELASHAATIVELTNAQMQNWREGELDLHREVNLLTLEVVGRLLFSRSLGDFAEEILKGEEIIQRLSSSYGTSPRQDEMFTRTSHRLLEIAGTILHERLEHGGNGDLLGHLIAACQEKSATAEEAVEEVNTFILAGYVTTANTVAAAFWLLAKNEEAQARLHGELDRVLGQRAPTVEDLPQLRYCEAIVLEELRMYPPVWSLGREALKEVEVGHYLLPENSKLFICPWLLHHDERYFPEPEKFSPERWENDLRDRLPRGSYIPFSIGSRSCIGERLAMLESTLILARIAQRWRFSELPSKPDPGWTPQVLYWPRRGIRLAAKLRASA